MSLSAVTMGTINARNAYCWLFQVPLILFILSLITILMKQNIEFRATRAKASLLPHSQKLPIHRSSIFSASQSAFGTLFRTFYVLFLQSQTTYIWIPPRIRVAAYFIFILGFKLHHHDPDFPRNSHFSHSKL